MAINKRFFKSLPIISLMGISLSLCLVSSLRNNNVNKANAAININDYSKCDEAFNNKTAQDLLNELRTITSPGQAGSYNQLWNTYKTAYVKNNKIFDYYSSSSSFSPGGNQCGSYSGEGSCYNREHSIPQSWWGGGTGTGTQGADPFIVVPTDGYVNNKRGNHPMGVVASATYTSNGGFSKLGSSASTYGFSGTVFEPNDSVKGDFARIHFYAIAKYANSYSWTSGGSSTFSGSASKHFGLTEYAIKLFSAWSSLDPVDEWEASVNNKLANIQGNRNPFIDHPNYADKLWGDVEGYTQYGDKPAPTPGGDSSSSTSQPGGGSGEKEYEYVLTPWGLGLIIGGSVLALAIIVTVVVIIVIRKKKKAK
ncbi:MAG: endonuclease [Bacilli bacterium]|nr:endonuclease [Bacilli bacterium]